ncbi:unnamed protein product [Echinostoma caproni]|uniref:SET and MYND domain-containing protein 4 n=1 Tax=Echinostoma caproni TaxID=27848 RepID=A0A183ATU8_9TREM|nr:unnamed protein product [Echinostoma caproni]
MASTDNNTVSLLWTRLMNTELQNISGNHRHMWNNLLSKSPPVEIDSPQITQVISVACSSSKAAAFYHAVLQYIERHATDGIRRLPMFVEDLASGDVIVKSVQTASSYREKGNTFFKARDWEAAAHSYRNGLLYAPDASYPLCGDSKLGQEAALLHGNLSASLFHQQIWDGCLWESLIALALHFSLPLQQGHTQTEVKAIPRLWTRVKRSVAELNCPKLLKLTNFAHPTAIVVDQLLLVVIQQSKMKNHPSSCVASDIPNLPVPRYGYQTHYSGLSSGLTVKSSSGKGRHVISTQSFVPGDVLAVEPSSGWSVTPTEIRGSPQKPNNLGSNRNLLCITDKHNRPVGHSCLLLPAQRMNRCADCLAPLHSIGFICPGCCDVAYCAPPSECFTRHCLRYSSVPWCFEQPVWHSAECR